MIDPKWFDAICCLFAPDLGGRDRAEIVATLGVQEEVLPFLAITAQAFADWPQARQALRTAARTLSRPASARPRTSGSADLARERAEMLESLRAVLDSRLADEIPSSSQHLGVGALINRYRSKISSASKDPHVFIEM